MKIGIFFGGPSREREVSFAGGRTIYDNLNKSLFEPVPIFVDSLGNFILLNWEYIYKGTIRDFYPPIEDTPPSPHHFQVYVESLGEQSPQAQQAMMEKVGRPVSPTEFRQLFDFAFLALHGPYGEDGSIQGLLEWYRIPYSGSGILPSSIGINKITQSALSRSLDFAKPYSKVMSKDDWLNADKAQVFAALKAEAGLPLVVKAPQQGSSIGVSIIREDDPKAFEQAVSRALFTEVLMPEHWNPLDQGQKAKFIENLVDIRQGIGLPLYCATAHGEPHQELVYHPEDLLQKVDAHFAAGSQPLILEAVDSEEAVLFEGFIEGQEFSCIVVQDEDGQPISLPPTEIVKFDQLFDYRSKYLPGMSRKVTPINTSPENIRKVQEKCCELFNKLKFNVYARIDGFLRADGEVFLNDPNTTSGMLPSSFFFHQAAEIGLNPSQFITYIIRTSLSERVKTGKDPHRLKRLLQQLDSGIAQLKKEESDRIKVAVIMGGYSSERHISIESGRNIYEKLASSEKYEPLPIFLTGKKGAHELYLTPISIMLKDNADDIRDKIGKAMSQPPHETVQENMEMAKGITEKYVGDALLKPRHISYEELAAMADVAFIALHGRPGEDGEVQTELQKVGLPFNGSAPASAATTIDKFKTNALLRQHGFKVAEHALFYKKDWQADPQQFCQHLTERFAYPFIAKPADDGCSSAVKKIKSKEELEAFAALIFREGDGMPEVYRKVLQLARNEEFPHKTSFLVETLVTGEGAKHFLEITGGLLTHHRDGEVVYEVFEPSEALATGDVLSLEEKFLAGQGQNITPARYGGTPEENRKVSATVRQTLEQVARLLKVEGYARIDAFVRIMPDDSVETVIIEINSLPGMTPATCIFHQAALNKYKPADFIDQILTYGMGKQ